MNKNIFPCEKTSKNTKIILKYRSVTTNKTTA